MFNHKRFLKGQAVLELAVFGTLIMLAFSAVLIYGQRLDFTQDLKMEAFRKALRMAYSKNSSVSYTLKKNTRIANMFTGFGQGQLISPSASSSVMWQKGGSGAQDSDDQQSFSIYDVNDYIFALPRDKERTVTDVTGEEKQVKATASVWKEEATIKSNYGSTTLKDENVNRIDNARSANLSETVATKLYTRYDLTPIDENEDPIIYGPREYEDGPEFSIAPQGANLAGADSIEYVPFISEGIAVNGIVIHDKGRMDYSKSKAGTVINKERTWDTSN